jgi:hypothetical protein
MRKQIALAVASAAMLVPANASAANPGSDNASECGAQHGMFAFPAHAALIPAVPESARSGAFKHGTIGDRASSAPCHPER